MVLGLLEDNNRKQAVAIGRRRACPERARDVDAAADVRESYISRNECRHAAPPARRSGRRRPPTTPVHHHEDLACPSSKRLSAEGKLTEFG